jgi:drug/metabolite transporter (DMT)-like permease
MKLSPQQALLRALVATLFFCSAPACVRSVGLNAYSLGIARLGLASLGMFAILGWQGKLAPGEVRNWPARTWRALLLVGLAFGCHWLLFFLSIKLASADIGAIGFSTYGIHLLFLGWLLGLGTVTAVDVGGLLLALVGTMLLVPEFNLRNEHTLGLIAGVLSGLAAALLPLLHQRYADVDNNLRTWGQFTFALPVFLVFWPLSDWHLDSRDVALVLYLGLGIALVGHGLWIQATTALSTTTTSILSYLYLPSSLVFSYFAIGERLTARMLVGACCVLVANALVLWRQAKLRALEANIPETT